MTKDTGRKETDSLTIKFYFGVGAQHTAETREHTDDEKECPRFSEKEGGWAWGKEIKGYVLTVVACSRQSPALNSWSILFLLLANSDTAMIRIRVEVIFFQFSKGLQVLLLPILTNKYTWYIESWPVTTRCGFALYIYELFSILPIP